jgi:BlaI family penicillinase repressor
MEREAAVTGRRTARKRTRREAQPRLPDAELDVLACLWRRGKATARQVREALERYRPMAHGSVATLLGRLQSKGLVSREKGAVGKAFVYAPTVRQRLGYRRVVRELLRRIFGGNSVALVASLFETQPPTSAELEDLQRLLDELRTKRKEQ